MSNESVEQRNPAQPQLLYRDETDAVEIGKDNSGWIILTGHFNGHMQHINYLEEDPNHLIFYCYKIPYDNQTVRHGTLPELTQFIYKVKSLLSKDPANQNILDALEKMNEKYAIKLNNQAKAKEEAQAARQRAAQKATQKLAADRAIQEEQNKLRRAEREQKRLERAAQKEALKKEKARWTKLNQQQTTSPVAEKIDADKVLVYGKLNGMIMCAIVDKKQPQYQVLTKDSVRPMEPEEVSAFYEHVVNHFEERADLYDCLANFCREYGYFKNKKLPVMTQEQAQELLTTKILPTLTNDTAVTPPVATLLATQQAERH